MKRISRFVAAGLALVLLAACGDDGDTSNSAPASTAVSSTAAPSSSTDSTSPSTTEASAAGSTASSRATTEEHSDWDAVVTAASEEGTVKLYSVMLPAIAERLEKAFETEYPKIDLQITRLLSAEIDGRLDAESSTGADGADLVTHVNYAWMTKALRDGKLTALQGPDATAPEWVDSGYVRDGHLQLTLLPAIGIARNTSLVRKELAGFEDFLDPTLGNGVIGIVDPAAAAVGDFYAFLEDEYGSEFLEKLAAQKPRLYSSAVPLEQALVAGEIGATLYSSAVGIGAAADKGAPVEFRLPKPSWSPTNVTYILARAAHPNAAQVLANFLATRSGQAAIAADNISPLAGIEGTAGGADTVTPINIERVLDPEFASTYYDRWRAVFGR